MGRARAVTQDVVVTCETVTITCPDTINAEIIGSSTNINITNPNHNGTSITGVRSDGQT